LCYIKNTPTLYRVHRMYMTVLGIMCLYYNNIDNSDINLG